MTLLECLKSMKELGWEFDCISNFQYSNDYNCNPDEVFEVDGMKYRIPTIQEVEDAVVEMDSLVDTNFSLTIDFYEWARKWVYSITTNIQKPDDFPKDYTEASNTDRLLAVCQLWIKLKEQEK